MTQKEVISILLNMVSTVRFDVMKIGSKKWKKYEQAIREAEKIIRNG
jgi:hypothetical protein